jgi:hypothetical protein
VAHKVVEGRKQLERQEVTSDCASAAWRDGLEEKVSWETPVVDGTGEARQAESIASSPDTSIDRSGPYSQRLART